MRSSPSRPSDNFSDLDSLRLEDDSDSAPLQMNSPQVYAEPEEKWPEHAVPRTVSAKAVLSEAADVRPTAAPSRSSHPSVLDGGRGSSLSLLDTTGDGQPNLVGIDTTGDGFVDSLAVDTTGDGRIDHVCSAGTDPASIHLVDTSVRLDSPARVVPRSLACFRARRSPRLPRAQGDGLVDAVTLSAGCGGPRVHNAQAAVVQSPARPSLVPEIQLLGIDVDAANMPPFSPLPSPLSSARSSRSALSEGGAMALARSRSSRDALTRRTSCQQVSDSAAQAAPSLGLSAAGEPGGAAALGASDGRHCARCEEMTLVASAFGGLCYHCHSFPRAETWRQLRARFALIAAFRAALASSSDPCGDPPPRVSSMFDLPGLELQVSQT